MSNHAYFAEKISQFMAQEKDTARRLNIVGTVRVAWFLSFLITFVYFANIRQLQYSILAFVIFLIGFGLLVILYNRLKFAQMQLNYLIKINEEDQNRLINELSELPDGNEYLDAKHNYAADLDIVGANSIFQLLNRTSTIPGEELLVNRLLGGALPVAHVEYQETVREIAALPEFIQEHQALGRHFDNGSEAYEKFNNWLNDEEGLTFVERNMSLLYLLPAIFLVGFIITSVFSITYYALLPIIAVNFYLVGINHAKTSKTVEQTAEVVSLLKTYVRHLSLLRQMDFKANFTRALKASLFDAGHDAQQDIQYLSRLLDQLQARKNLLHVFINIPLLLDLQWMTRLQQWKASKRELLTEWTNSLAEFEVIVSLSGIAFIKTDWAYPALTDEAYILDGKAFGHPLISADKKVANDFTLSGPGTTMIITGPNMAGKSTFLRTLALNVVLAQMGGAVCAKEMTVSRELKVFTVMRTQDNLSENISSFYAELDRIKQLLAAIEKGDKVLYFLDELLKGTNSADRHRGAEALVKQLISLQVSGFVSTHDIELGQLTQQMDEVSNYSFESIITDGAINFDYTIRAGICSSFNASELMRRMGIDI